MVQKSFENKRVIWALFGLLLLYFLLRAWFLAPLHDETATFFHYIELGDIWSDTALLDANNHLLNSWLGRFLYLIFGESFFALRLPALAAFCIYFWSSYGLIKRIYFGAYAMYVFLALNTIPWITDYFAYTRGYGMAIGFFMAALYFLSTWIQQFKWQSFGLLTLCSYLAVLSNLTYLISSLLLLTFTFGFLLLQWKKLNGKQRYMPLVLMLVFGLALLPLIYHTLTLKYAGALYYGSLDGLWWVTGKSLSRYVFFTDNDNLRIVYGFFVLVCAGVFIWQWRDIGFKKLILEQSTWFTALFVGNISAILFLAKVMHVNYPEDRAAMYLVPLGLLAFTSLIKYVKGIRIVLLLLIYFPLVFILKINLSTSVFSPDDRMSEAFYLQASKILKSENTIDVNPIMQLNYARFERSAHRTKHPARLRTDFDPQTDIILTKWAYLAGKKVWKKTHKMVASDPNGYVLLQKNKQSEFITILDTVYTNQQSGEEFINLAQLPIQEGWRNKYLVVTISSDIATKNFKIDTYNLVVGTNDSLGNSIRYDYFNLRWYLGTQINRFKLNYPFGIDQLKAEESQLILYIWNREKHQSNLTNTRIRIKALK